MNRSQGTTNSVISMLQWPMMSLTPNETKDRAEKFKNNSFGVLVEDNEDVPINDDTHTDCRCALHDPTNQLHKANKKHSPNQRQRKRRWEARTALHASPEALDAADRCSPCQGVQPKRGGNLDEAIVSGATKGGECGCVHCSEPQSQRKMFIR